jgi:hypothetical protein
MAFKLLETLNESVRENEEYQALVESVICEFFGDQAASTPEECAALWDAAKDAVRSEQGTLTEVENAAMARAGERDWVKQAAADSTERQDNKDRTLGIKKKGQPEEGHLVVMQGGVGRIVAVDAVDKAVIIQNKQGQEKVFKMDQLLGPKNVNGKMAWALQGTTPGTQR